ncbi:hypothetical protein PAXRUDRAFT_825426 [Paxillus rubicundulus Ve08.2h10]|uniref:Uncharacterized protein n=1 Tax=Paxillus rubicundulus Ve08.2h10 TaxID=930991 RepID=A0A0D0E688_9AGAM|nr:hypothetical protein PAXRUDRAFT_825426 [Paxillus rubicundulus Ve08.2h10]
MPVSGMKQEFNMQGNDSNVSIPSLQSYHVCLHHPSHLKIYTIFTCGYIVGMIPSNLDIVL